MGSDSSRSSDGRDFFFFRRSMVFFLFQNSFLKSSSLFYDTVHNVLFFDKVLYFSKIEAPPPSIVTAPEN